MTSTAQRSQRGFHTASPQPRAGFQAASSGGIRNEAGGRQDACPTAGTRSEPVHAVFIKTQDGVFTAYFSSQGLVRLDFPNKRHSGRFRNGEWAKTRLGSLWVARTEAALEDVLSAETPKRLPPLDLSAGTRFQRTVWQALRRIPPKMTRSYSEVAKAIGRPKAARAVGQACGANPIPLIIPCHRVLAAHGALGGFSCGLELKRKLLRREGIKIKGC
ncbi:MAG: methylated-DNA--[protein]-cysteine S-methyltransferase [Verrucomicrobia bacterium]|nr:methylated-DNA--[protein]-cysteine S-methyltransferase [Verrucomicrobiota bacterium]